MFTPVEDKQEADEHAAKVGKMGHAVVRAEDTLEELDGNHADDEPLGLDRHEEVEIDVFVGEHHAEGQQQGVDGSRGTYGEVNAGYQQMQQSGTDAADKVVEEETAHTPITLQYGSEHPKGEHVEEEMVERTVHEHVGQRLPDVEAVDVGVDLGRFDAPKSHDVVEVDALCAQHVVGGVAEYVDDKQMLNGGGQYAETLWLVL